LSDVVIVGAGAIGRGYLPWVLDRSFHRLHFVDVDPTIVEGLRRRERYKTFRVNGDTVEETDVEIAGAYFPEQLAQQNLTNVAATFMSVGPRSCARAAGSLRSLSALGPIVLCENDPASVQTVREVTGSEHVYFSIPDVITSNTAPRACLERDPLAVMTEAGTLFIDERARGIRGDYVACTAEQLQQQWTAKLYLHNTPHCVAAYLGALAGVTYVHEAMAVPRIDAIVRGAMNEMLSSLKLEWEIPHEFLDWYASKELARFHSQRLHDPVSRVAREPLRKLDREGRLLGAAQICLSLGFVPENVLRGVGAAMLFENEQDADRHISFMRRAVNPDQFLTHVLGLRRGEALELVLNRRLDAILRELSTLRDTKGP
jgi:mannitol-1-phosphate 5-dehydrogenase